MTLLKLLAAVPIAIFATGFLCGVAALLSVPLYGNFVTRKVKDASDSITKLREQTQAFKDRRSKTLVDSLLDDAKRRAN